jgi:hypothetical protein
MTTDYKVRFRRYQDVGELALRARGLLGIANYFTFNIVKAIRRLVGKKFGKSGTLNLDIFDNDDDLIAYVTFNPLTLHVHREVWDDAELGEPKSRFILAHELGHILMHGYYRQAYSEDKKSRLRFVPPEESAEAQANWFAACFLAPDHLARHCRDEGELCLQFDFPSDFASVKFDDLKRKAPPYSGDSCSKCGNFTLVVNGAFLKCDNCGATKPK